MRRIFLVLGAWLALMGGGGPALGQDLTVNGTTVSLGGIKTYNKVTVTNGGVIKVTPFNGTDKVNTGNLQIVANSITVDATSAISADGAGYQPVLCDHGTGPTTTAGGRGGCAVLDSGGGGAHFGKGGRGTKDCPSSSCVFPQHWEEDCGYLQSGACQSVAGCYNNDGLPSVAGVPYLHSVYQVEFGAAGGDKGCRDGDGKSCVVSGPGGGRLVLAAVNSAKTGVLDIKGKVTADGWRGCGDGNDSGGGGAGGTLLLVGDSVTVGAGARVSAAGGLGGDTNAKVAGSTCPSCSQNPGGTCDDCGGGGGGGIVAIKAGAPALLHPLAEFNVSGALGGTCAICKGEAGGGAGELQLSGVYEGEVCDGYDNDFDGQVDEGLGTVTCGSGSCSVTVQACNTTTPGNVYPNDCLPLSLPTCMPALTDTRGRFMVVMDTSGSMLTDLSGVPTFGDGSSGRQGLDTDGDGKTNDSRLYKAKEALTKVISAYPEIDFGLARFVQDSASGLACQLAQWVECSGGCCTYDNPTNNTGGTPPSGPCSLNAGAAGTLTVQPVSQGEECINYAGHCGPPRRGADILVGFEKPLGQKLMWLDHKETSFHQSSSPGNFCNYSGGGDCELRGTGPTPLAGALDAARSYLAATKASDQIASCRKYAVILLTDGAETCSGSPTTAAADLLKLGISTYVIGFSVLSTEKSQLDAIAKAGGTSAAFFAGDEAQLASALAKIVADSVVFEKCNNADDDCDLLVDEDFTDKGKTCDNGQLGVCYKTGTYVCKADGSGVECSAAKVTAGTETCNGLDDDCDGQIDEIPGCLPCLPEVCDGKDNDCDGTPDDNPLFVGLPCGSSVGECLAGKWACETGQLVCKGSTGPGVETCDGKDNNCDTIVDSFTEACYPASTGCVVSTSVCQGTCKIGSRLCTAGTWGACTGYQGPQSEVCNGLDDDCDGSLDNGVSTMCKDYSTCLTYTTCAACPTAPLEICDGKDNDCNGTADDNPMFEGLPCGSPVGECTAGKWVCETGKLVCKGGSLPGVEVCDLKDNDCNGVVDDKVTGLPSSCGSSVGECKPGTPACQVGKVVCVGGVSSSEELCDCKDNDCDGTVDNNAKCPGGSACVNCKCLLPCKAGNEFSCPGGYVCKDGRCHPTKCADVTCKATQVCLEGVCVEKCADVKCNPWEKCNPYTGTCEDNTCQGKGCPAGKVCKVSICVPDPCPFGKCPAGMQCVDGACYKTCLGVTCPGGTVCFRGDCLPKDPCDLNCSVGQVCKLGAGGKAQCVEDPCKKVTCWPGQICVKGACEASPCATTRCPTGFVCKPTTTGKADCDPIPGMDHGKTNQMVAAGGSAFGCAVGGRSGGEGVLWAAAALAILWARRWRRRGRP